MKRMIFLAGLFAAATGAQADTASPVVLELFTSQGCSSCPPADALLQQLAQRPDVIALSFHVHYWDYLGWKDRFSSADNTNRQRQYASNLHLQSVFTPQLIVNGFYSAVGSDPAEVTGTIAMAHDNAPAVPICLLPDASGHQLDIHIAAASTQVAASVWAVRYQRHASTTVNAGENAGHTLTSINNVTQLSRLGTWQGKTSDYTLPLPQESDEGVAILVQNDGQGRIITAARYPN